MKKNTKIWLGIILVIILIGVVGAGGKMYLDKKAEAEHQAAVEVVKENENLIKDNVYRDDKNKRIKSVTIDYDSVEVNPMGGVMLQGYVNGDKKMFFNGMLDIRDESGKIESTGISPSADMQRLMGDIDD